MQVHCVIIGSMISTDLPFNVSTPFNTYQQADALLTFNSVFWLVSRSQTAFFLLLQVGKKRVWYTYIKNSVHRDHCSQGDCWLLLIDESLYFLDLQTKHCILNVRLASYHLSGVL